MEEIELRRQDVSSHLDAGRRSELGQFFTPASVAGLMAGMAEAQTSSYRVLDAGAGIGSLSAALVHELRNRTVRPHDLRLTAFEVDPFLQPYLRKTLARCQATAASAGIECVVSVEAQDFIHAGVAMIRGGMFDPQRQVFDCAILNPPYHKIRSDSDARLLLRSVGIETSNLYTAFVALAVELLVPGGELIAITPRSFCNGPYFRPFRESLLREMRLRRLHIFESRGTAFSDDAVLQENVILHAVKCPTDEPQRPVWITSSVGPGDDLLTTRQVLYDRVIRPGDPDSFIHIVPDELGQAVADSMLALTARLTDLGITVSTGRVVDFRARAFLRTDPEPGSVPLIYPTHLLQGGIAWPKQSRKPNAMLLEEATRYLLVPAGIYVLVKRFTSKEERRPVVAAVYDSATVAPGSVAFENHLNYYHEGGRGLSLDLARGLAAFLNSTMVDGYFRQFNGHTQVNATDLRSLPYPPRHALERLGQLVGAAVADQDLVDSVV